MCRFIESIRCDSGLARQLPLHQQRVDQTFHKHFPHSRPLNLKKIIEPGSYHQKHKCRIEYGENDYSIAYSPYETPLITSLKVVESDEISYSYKSIDRHLLGKLYERRLESDDIIIVKKGRVTDSYFANLAFYDGGEWYTSNSPLLKGVMRASLISQGKLNERLITVGDIARYEKVCLINAMLDLDQMSLPTKDIIIS
ncbi:MAG: aminotransferase class IV [Reichenbachiella sp.]|uniref:aminotransferase class IV n=1 Tax=Reichenbachiella sp. TaxID=2184521 RepID=UPI003263A1C5